MRRFFSRIAAYISSKTPMCLRYRATITLADGELLRGASISGPVTVIAAGKRSGADGCVFMDGASMFFPQTGDDLT